METEKGCVYFFKHVGLSPIKIGYSENESPINRFDQFKTYAPFGAELIGFIRTNEPKELETLLHQKFAAKRLKGEWFEMTIEEAKKTIEFYSNLEDIQEMNEFQIAWAKKLIKKEETEFKEVKDIFDLHFIITEEKNENKLYLNYQEIAEHLSLDKKIVSKYLKSINAPYKLYRIKDIVKKAIPLKKIGYE
jgi:hypothetical protein